MTKIIALAVILLCAWHQPAEALPLIAGGIAAVLGVTGAAAAFLNVVVSLGVAVGSSLISRALTPRPRQDQGQAQAQAQPEQQVTGLSGIMQTGGVVGRTIPFGKTVVSHSLVYHAFWGTEGKTPNAVYTVVYAISDVPVAGLAEVWVNGSLVTLSGDSNADGVPVAEYRRPPHGGGDPEDFMRIRLVDGTQTLPDYRLVAIGAQTPSGRTYDVGRVGRGVAYVVVTMRAHPELFKQTPQFKFVVSGAKFYDPRFDSSVGGTGAQRFSDQSTWAWTQNPVMIAYNVMRGISFEGRWLFGGQSTSAYQLPLSSWFAAMNECEAWIDLGGGGAEPQFTAGGEIRVDQDDAADVIEKLMLACMGRMGETGGTYKPRVGAPAAAVFSITDDSILSTESQQFAPFKSLAQQVNGVTGKYVNPGEGWISRDAPPIYNAEYEAEDGDRRQVADLKFDYVTSGTQVQRLMAAALAAHRRERSHTLPLPPSAYVLEPGDVISWTSARNGYANKLFEVSAVEDLANGNVVVSCFEVDPADYFWSPSYEQTIIQRPPSIIWVPPQSIEGWTAQGVRVGSASGDARPGIKLSWSATNLDDVDGVQFQIRLYGGTEIVVPGDTTAWQLGALIVTTSILSDTRYEVRGRIMPRSSRQTTWSAWLDVTTPVVGVGWGGFEASIQALLDRAKRSNLEAEAAIKQLSLLAQSIIASEAGQREKVEQTLSVALEDLNASITETRVVAIDANSAVAQVTSEVAVARGGAETLSARVTQIDQARIDGDAFTAASVTSVETQSNTNNAKLSQILQTSGGTFVRWAVVGNINGITGGLTLTGVQAIDGSAASFSLEVNGSLIVNGTITGAKVQAFSLTGTQIAGHTITASHIVTESLTANEIATGTLTTRTINGEAVTFMRITRNAGTVTIFGNTSFPFTNVLNLTFYVGYPCTISVDYAYTWSGGVTSVNNIIRFKLNGTIIEDVTHNTLGLATSRPCIMDVSAAGWHTVQIDIATSFGSLGISQQTLTLVGQFR